MKFFYNIIHSHLEPLNKLNLYDLIQLEMNLESNKIKRFKNLVVKKVQIPEFFNHITIRGEREVINVLVVRLCLVTMDTRLCHVTHVIKESKLPDKYFPSYLHCMLLMNICQGDIIRSFGRS